LKLKETHDPTADTLLFVKTELKNLAFLDPWNNEYVYEHSREDGLSEFRVRSLGPDGKSGEGFDADNVE
ncbi:MAG: type II secretion system protein GspG, partial [Opitutales bacterium]